MTERATFLRSTPIISAEVRAYHRRRMFRHILGQALLWLFIGAGLVFMVTPGIWMIISSFKTRAEIQAVPLKFFPEKFRWDNFVTAINWTNFPLLFRNSLIYTGSITLVNMFTCTWGGYTFGKLRWPGRDVVFLGILATMMVPGFLTTIPRYVMTSKFGMMNSYWGMTIPFLTGSFGIFLARQFMLGIPDELLDASTVDGCNALSTFFRIVVPLAKPVIAVQGIFVFNWSWDDLLWPILILTKRQLWTIPVGIANLRLQAGADYYELQMAAGTMAIIPVLIVFLVLQKHIIQGVALSGLKG